MQSRTSRGGPGLFEWLRRITRRLSGRLVRWVAERVRIPAPLRWLGALIAPGGERSFGSRWVIAMLVITAVLGIVVALLLSPVVALIALLIAAVWALVRHGRRADRTAGVTTPASATR
jgi:hypothetical protein